MANSTRSSPLVLRLDLGLRACARHWPALIAREDLRRDVVQGLLLAAQTFPLSLLLASLAGAPASAALLSASIGSAVGALLGGTRVALAGPGMASALVASTVITRHGLDGLGLVLFLVGLLQVVTGALGIGRFVRVAPRAVLRACLFGTGAVIVLRQLPHAIGSNALDPVALAIAGGAAALGVLSLLCPWLPGGLLALVVAAPAVHFLGLKTPMLAAEGAALVPHLPALPAGGLVHLLGSVFELWAVLTLGTALNTAALEKLHADHGNPDRVDPDQELIGAGLATVALAFVNGLPATQLIARSAVGVRLGIRSRRPALIQAAVVLVVGFALAPLLPWVPVAALTGIAVAVGLPLLDPRPLRALGRVSGVELAVALAAIAGMVSAGILTGMLLGLALSFGIVALRMARTRALLHRSGGADAPHQVTFSGPITFLAVLELERLGRELAKLDPAPGLVIDLRSVVTLDANGALALVNALDEWRGRGGRVALLGPSAQVRDRLERADRHPRPLPEPLTTGMLEGAIAANDRALDGILGRAGVRLSRTRLLAGLTRFREERRSHYDSLFAQLADGQQPHTMFVTCADSRIDPALLMGTHPGDLFIVRAIGALVPPAGDALPQEGAAVEYGVGVLGVRTIVVCGHSKCGAISALKQGQVPAELTTLGAWAQHAERIAGNVAEFPDADAATRAVTVRQVENLLTYPLVRDAHARGDLQIHAWFYDLGKVELFEWNAERGEFVDIAADDGPETSVTAA